MRPSYLEPRTDVPAAVDWSTGLILAELRGFGRVGAVAMLGSLALIIWVIKVSNTTAGTVGVAVLLGLVAVLGVGGLVLYWMERRPYRRGLLEVPWRRCSATVVATDVVNLLDRLVVFDGPRTLVVRGFLPDLLDLVLHHQELFLCGPDERGHVAIRVAGLCRLFRARAVQEDWRPREREPYLVNRPLDDPAVAFAFRYFRWGKRIWSCPVGAGALGAVELLLSLNPVAPVGIVVAGVLLGGAAVFTYPVVVVSRWYGQAIEGVQSATSWTPVPVTLFPWEPDREVAGLVQLPTGGTALIQFPIPNLNVVANIADTGMMWIAGDPRNVVAVGLPHLPVLTFGMLHRDKSTPDEPRQPLVLRTKQTALRGVPALGR